MRSPNIGSDLLTKWRIKILHKNNGAKVDNFFKSSTSSSPTGESRATSLPPIGSAFMCIETSSNKYGHESVC